MRTLMRRSALPAAAPPPAATAAGTDPTARLELEHTTALPVPVRILRPRQN